MGVLRMLASVVSMTARRRMEMVLHSEGGWTGVVVDGINSKRQTS